MTTRKSPTGWAKGKSGNPKGRPPGVGQIAQLRAAIESSVPGILDSMVASALSGDVAAARLLLERTVPPIKPVELPQMLNIPADASLTDQGKAVMRAVADGEIATGQAAALIAALAALGRVIELDELTERITRLEQHGKS